LYLFIAFTIILSEFLPVRRGHTLGGAGSTVLIIVVLVLGIALSFGLQFWRMSRSPMGKVLRITSNIKFDEKLSREFGYSRVRKFKTGAWMKNKEAVGFLPEGLIVEMDKLFYQLAEINDRIDSAMKFRSNSYLASIDADQLTEPLSECRDQLQGWITENIHNPEYLPKKYGFFRLRR
jgi:hypothetical protein